MVCRGEDGICRLPISCQGGIGSRDELTVAGADAILDDPDELPAAVRRLLADGTYDE